MKKIIFTSMLFVSAYILMAQQIVVPNDFVVDLRQSGNAIVVHITGYSGKSVDITIPEKIQGYPVVAIGDNAFRSKQLSSVIFPSTLNIIGNYAFFDNRLTSVVIPASVTTIGIGAFDNNLIALVPNSQQPNIQTIIPVQSLSTTSAGGGATYIRTYTIEPARSGSIYVQQAPATQPVVSTVVRPQTSAPSTVIVQGTTGSNYSTSGTTSAGGYTQLYGSAGMPQTYGVPAPVTTATGSTTQQYLYTERPTSNSTRLVPESQLSANTLAATQLGRPFTSREAYYYQYDLEPLRRPNFGAATVGSNNNKLNLVNEDTVDLITNQYSLYPGPPPNTQEAELEKMYWGPIGARANPQ